ncbi:hypothetical protein H8N00_01140 [Streptomyces sp. AC563]|nr:hypothetical protein [Streptomyces buecherae]MBC3987536.1 hypothetical protein [Streptomyces buecherae]
MHTTVNALEARPGSELLQRLAKLIGTTQVLMVRTSGGVPARATVPSVE